MTDADLNLQPLPTGNIVNLTPHPVRLLGADGELIAEYPPDGRLARLGEHVVDPRLGERIVDPLGVWRRDLPRTVAGVPIATVAYGAVDDHGAVAGMPAAEDGTYYVVSLVTALALRHLRADLLIPYDQVRNADGSATTGCRMFARLAP